MWWIRQGIEPAPSGLQPDASTKLASDPYSGTGE